MLMKKKLPFKATALFDDDLEELDAANQAASSVSPRRDRNGGGNNDDDTTTTKDKHGKDDDGLGLFRQSRAMAPILAADREKKLLRKKRQLEMEEQQRRAAAAAAQARKLSETSDDGNLSRSKDRQGRQETNWQGEEEDEDERDVSGSEVPSLTAVEASTPATPPSKRSRGGSSQISRSQMSRSSKRQRSSQDTPLLSHSRATSSQWSSQRSPLKPKRPAHSQGTPVISLLSDSEDDGTPPWSAVSRGKLPQVKTPPPPETTDSGNDLDDDIFEGAAAAESEDAAQRRTQSPRKLGQNNETPRKSEGGTTSGVKEEERPGQQEEVEPENDERAEFLRKARQRRDQQAKAVSSPSQQQSVLIFVQSEIPHAKPLAIRYLYTKPLRILRDCWLATQRRDIPGFPAATAAPDDDFIITWRRRIVYPSSSLQTMNIRPLGGGFTVGSSGERVRAGAGTGTGVTDDGRKILLEIWTAEGYAEMERQREEDGGPASDNSENHTGSGGGDDDDDVEQVWLKVILREQKPAGLDITNLSVLAETPVRTLIDAFRKKHGIGGEDSVEIRLDGEVLPEEDTMEAAGVEDMDALDVLVRRKGG